MRYLAIYGHPVQYMFVDADSHESAYEIAKKEVGPHFVVLASEDVRPLAVPLLILEGKIMDTPSLKNIAETRDHFYNNMKVITGLSSLLPRYFESQEDEKFIETKSLVEKIIDKVFQEKEKLDPKMAIWWTILIKLLSEKFHITGFNPRDILDLVQIERIINPGIAQLDVFLYVVANTIINAKDIRDHTKILMELSKTTYGDAKYSLSAMAFTRII